MTESKQAPLDEIQWKHPPILANMGGLHSNTILFYFAESPFFERTSNNAVVLSQALNNQQMYPVIQTREAFEAHLRTMSGLEFIVGEEPAESGPGMGTGVWVIRKQTRRKRYQQEDEITIHASYFVVGENIYVAPRLSDMLACHIVSLRRTCTSRSCSANEIPDDNIKLPVKSSFRSRQSQTMEAFHWQRLQITHPTISIRKPTPWPRIERSDAHA